MPRWVKSGLICAAIVATGAAQSHCDGSDAEIKLKRDLACSCGFGIPQCTITNETAEHDWPSQVVYMHDAIIALQTSPSECLTTEYANDTVSWLNGTCPPAR